MKRSTTMALGAGILAGSALALLEQRKRRRRNSLRIQSQEGIDLEEYVFLGGIEQYLYHRGENRSNPVVLFLHSGPGRPGRALLERFQTGWEHRVTVVHWDQRGTGRTYRHSPNPLWEANLERMVEDCDEVISYLKRKYHTDRIILLGHGWGSLLAAAYLKRYPKGVEAYIGVGQLLSPRDQEYQRFSQTMEAALEADNGRDIARLRAAEPYPGSFDHFQKQAGRVHRIEKRYQRPTSAGVCPLDSPFYTLTDWLCTLRPGARKVKQGLLEELYSFHLEALGTTYQVPFFLIHGQEDAHSPCEDARVFLEQVQAPLRDFYPIAGAGHQPMLDRPENFRCALFSILDQLDELRETPEDEED